MNTREQRAAVQTERRAYVGEELVAVIVWSRRCGWEIAWPRRGWSRERVQTLKEGRAWVASLLHDKEVRWETVKSLASNKEKL